MKTKFVTTSIAYINAEPHIGFLFELLAADIFARHWRSQSEDSFFLTGTDEHGAKVASAATTAGLARQQFADQISGKYLALKEQFDLSFDYFIRTTDPTHQEFVKQTWRTLLQAGQIKKGIYRGRYCTGCEAFKQPSEIADNHCLVHNQPLEKVEEENYFFEPGGIITQKIADWINYRLWPSSRRQEAINVLHTGAFKQISVSRPATKNSWGIGVPDDPSQVIYVWFDALLNYLSIEKITGQKLWPADIQIIGKDILKFHAIVWPAILLALGRDLPAALLVHGFINVDGRKLSKSTGHIVRPQELLDHYALAGDLAVDAVRYLLFRQLSFYDDSNFVWAEFDALYNGELANGLGNLVARVIGIGKKVAKFELPQPAIDRLAVAKLDFKDHLETANERINQADSIITAEKLWENSNDKLTKFNEVVSCLVEATGILLPFMPKTAGEIRRQLTELKSKPLFPRLNQ